MKKQINTEDLLSKDRLFLEPFDSDYGPIETYEVVEKVPSECPHCHSNNVRRKGKQLKKRHILHTVNGRLQKTILIRPRCECRDCKKTFYPHTEEEFDNKNLSDQAADIIANTVLEHPETSISKIAKDIRRQTGKGSSSNVDRKVKKRYKELSDAIQIASCYKLFYIPFKYRKNPRCYAIVGLNSTERKLYLLDILKDGSEKSLKKFYNKTQFFKDDVKLSLADLNRNTLDFVDLHYAGRAGVLTRITIERIKDYRGKCSYKALDALEKIITDDTTKLTYYNEAFSKWKGKFITSDPTHPIELEKLYDEILAYQNECWIGTFHKPWEPEFTRLLDTIKIRERSNESFEFMAFRLMYANRAAVDSFEGKLVLHYALNIHEPIVAPIKFYGVDINKLYEEVCAEKERLTYL